MARHMTIEQLPYGKPVQSWLKDRYGETEANQIWEQTQQNYKNYLREQGPKRYTQISGRIRQYGCPL